MEKLFECVHCHKVGFTPWRACFSEQHLRCRICERVQTKTCPACSDSYHGAYQVLAEKMAVEMKVQLHCSYPGCEFSVQAGQKDVIENHIKTCPRRIIRCLYAGRGSCPWSGSIPDFFVHMHNTHCEMTCNRIYSQVDQLEWKAVPGQISFNVHGLDKLDDESNPVEENKTYFHFLRSGDGSLGLLMTELQAVEAIDPIPLSTFSWEHKLLWYSKPLGRFTDDKEMELKVGLQYQERRVETAVLYFGEEHVLDNMDITLDGISMDENWISFLPMGRNKKTILADLELVPVVQKRKREDEVHTSRKKAKKDN